MNTQSTTTISKETRGDVSSRRRRRIIAVVAAIVSTSLAWALVEGPGGVDLKAPVFEAGQDVFDVGLVAVILTSGLAALAAWAVLAVVERRSSNPRRTWTILAVFGLVLSFGPVVSGTGIDSADRWLLATLHVVTGLVLIPLMYWTIPGPRKESQ
jgi:CDP-diglyceride synthetase